MCRPRSAWWPALAVAGLCGTSCSSVPCGAEPGNYRVEWIEVPSDCLPIERLEALWLDPEDGCFAVGFDGAKCGLWLHDRSFDDGHPCVWPFAGGHAAFRSSDGGLARVGERWEGRIEQIEIADTEDAFADGGSYARRCGEARIAVTPEPGREPAATAPVARSSYADCTLDGSCPEGEECGCIPGTPFGYCYAYAPPPDLRPDLGQPCIIACKEGACLRAADDLTGGFGRCEPVPELGDPCGVSVDPSYPGLVCAGSGTYCDREQTCRAFPRADEPCGVGILPAHDALCPSGTSCDQGRICRPDPGLGEPCTPDAICPGSECCSEGFCDDAAPGGPVCAPLLGRGAPCNAADGSFSGNCASDLTCACGDEPCESGVCTELRHSGERCDEANVACWSGDCIDGVCSVQVLGGNLCGWSGIRCIPPFECLDHVCRLVPTDLAPCSAAGQCPYGAYCDESHVCRPKPAIGEPCACSGTSCCRNGFCDVAAAGGTPVCTPLRGRGEPCVTGEEATGNCELGLQCSCEEPTCAARVCLLVVTAGSSCGEPDTVCAAPLECHIGACRTFCL